MSADFYKIIHIFGILLAFVAMGGLTFNALTGSRDSGAGRKLAGMTHGIALLLILISGFGMLAKLQIGFEIWVWIKLVIWLLIGGCIALIRRMPDQAKLFWFLLPLLGTVAGYLAIYKPVF